jgi:hypothetical protein
MRPVLDQSDEAELREGALATAGSPGLSHLDFPELGKEAG